MNLNIIVHVQGKFADLKFTVFARSKQASIDTHALRNEVTLVWGSLRLAPITYEGRDGNTKKTIQQKWCYMGLPFRHEECAQLRTCMFKSLSGVASNPIAMQGKRGVFSWPFPLCQISEKSPLSIEA